MRTVYKHPLVENTNTVFLPAGSIILTADIDGFNNQLCIWYEFEVGTKATIEYIFHVICTGSHFEEDNKEYLATVWVPDECLRLHIYYSRQ